MSRIAPRWLPSLSRYKASEAVQIIFVGMACFCLLSQDYERLASALVGFPFIAVVCLMLSMTIKILAALS